MRDRGHGCVGTQILCWFLYRKIPKLNPSLKFDVQFTGKIKKITYIEETTWNWTTSFSTSNFFWTRPSGSLEAVRGNVQTWNPYDHSFQDMLLKNDHKSYANFDNKNNFIIFKIG